MRKAHVFLIGGVGLALALTFVTVFVLLNPQFTSVPGVRSSGVALVGGPFTLTDQSGKRVTEKDYLGKYMLVYFGYTYCPNICWGRLQVVTAALDALGEKADKIKPLFITIDPERDTPEVLADYISNFHQSLSGLTGTPEEIAKVAKAYRVYYAKVEDPNATDYLMDHVDILYLMGPDGKYVTHFGAESNPQKLADKLAQYIE